MSQKSAKLQRQQSASLTVQNTIHVGPIPSPDVIQKYELILPGAADRIIRMAEKEQEHQHQKSNRHQGHVFKTTLFGQSSALILGLSGIAGAVLLVINNKSLEGFGVFLPSLGTLVGLYFYGRKKPAPTPVPASRQIEGNPNP